MREKLRDVIERHNVSNVTALREMIRQLLANAAAPFTVNRFYNDLKSRGVPASKDLLHALLQVCTELTDKKTREREYRAIASAQKELPGASCIVLTQSATGLEEARRDAPPNTVLLPAWEWLLANDIA